MKNKDKNKFIKDIILEIAAIKNRFIECTKSILPLIKQDVSQECSEHLQNYIMTISKKTFSKF